MSIQMESSLTCKVGGQSVPVLTIDDGRFTLIMMDTMDVDYDGHSVPEWIIRKEVSFLKKASIRETLDHIPENSKIVIDT